MTLNHSSDFCFIQSNGSHPDLHIWLALQNAENMMQGLSMWWKQQKERTRNPWIFSAICVCVKLRLESYLVRVYMTVPSFLIHSELNLSHERERHTWGGGGGKRVNAEASAWLGARRSGGGEPLREARRMERVPTRQRNVCYVLLRREWARTRLQVPS